MGKIPAPETKRDEALIRDYLKRKGEGWEYSISQLGVRYARMEGDNIIPLTATRIHQILDKHQVEKNRIIRKSK